MTYLRLNNSDNLTICVENNLRNDSLHRSKRNERAGPRTRPQR